jgi:NADH:ubiquinone oxidoreductase subunit 5 (subunit L)/multisubunit Na+/H+ antiporter MnhA subunit
MSLLFLLFKSLDFSIVFSLVSILSYKQFYFFNVTITYIEAIAFFLFIACVGKSAQVGLHG